MQTGLEELLVIVGVVDVIIVVVVVVVVEGEVILTVIIIISWGLREENQVSSLVTPLGPSSRRPL